MIEKYRDLSIVSFGEKLLTVACDSCGGVGSLEMDILKASGRDVGYHTAFVALAETIAIGSKPILIIDTLSISLDSYGEAVLSGVMDAVREAGLNPDKCITGSSEENFTVGTTGMGVTVLGEINSMNFKPSPIDEIYSAVVIGKPLVGSEVLENKNNLLFLSLLTRILKLSYVLDVIPVGSKGIAYEAEQMADELKYSFLEDTTLTELISKSAGPATCAVAAIKSGFSDKLQSISEIPIIEIGNFIKKQL